MTPIPDTVRPLVERGEIGGRTVQIAESGEVECVGYEPRQLVDGEVRIRSVRTAISSGTEMTYQGREATNVRLRKRWNDELRLFEAGPPSIAYPLVVGYRAAGAVVESTSQGVPVGSRIYGAWRHTELTILTAGDAMAQRVPDDLSWDDAVDLAHMGPICVNAVDHAAGEHAGRPAVVFGAGVIGLLTAQVARATGAEPVYVVDRLPKRLEIATSLGLLAMDPAAGDVAATLKRRHGPEGIAAAWECTGSTSALHEAIRIPRRHGLVVAVGFYQGEAAGLRLGEEFHLNGIRVVSAQIGNPSSGETRATLRARTVELRIGGQLALGSLPRLTLPVERVGDAIAALRRPAEVLQVSLSYDSEEES